MAFSPEAIEHYSHEDLVSFLDARGLSSTGMPHELRNRLLLAYSQNAPYLGRRVKILTDHWIGHDTLFIPTVIFNLVGEFAKSGRFVFVYEKYSKEDAENLIISKDYSQVQGNGAGTTNYTMFSTATGIDTSGPFGKLFWQIAVKERNDFMRIGVISKCNAAQSVDGTPSKEASGFALNTWSDGDYQWYINGQTVESGGIGGTARWPSDRSFLIKVTLECLYPPKESDDDRMKYEKIVETSSNLGDYPKAVPNCKITWALDDNEPYKSVNFRFYGMLYPFTRFYVKKGNHFKIVGSEMDLKLDDPKIWKFEPLEK